MAADLMRLVPLVMLGFGNVGQSLARLLLRKESEIAERYGLGLRVVGIGTGSHGCALDQAGLDLGRALKLAAEGGDLAALSPGAAAGDSLELLQRSAAEALLESTPVNYQTGQPAIRYLQAALQRGMHVVSANKGPVVHAYRELSQLADRQRVAYRFESAVMDGAPIFSLWRDSLPAAQLQSFRGILNSTTNFILTQMEEGHSVAEAVKQAQAIGVAETDPSGDVEGWDAAIKVAALVNVLMGVPCSIDQVERLGIQQLDAAAVRQVLSEGKRWKLICSAVRQADGVQARVAPQAIGPEDPLYNVMGTSSAVTFVTDVLGDLTLTEDNPGPDTTAFGMLADLMGVVR